MMEPACMLISGESWCAGQGEVRGEMTKLRLTAAVSLVQVHGPPRPACPFQPRESEQVISLATSSSSSPPSLQCAFTFRSYCNHFPWDRGASFLFLCPIDLVSRNI